jgi:vesicle-associated membrane protein 7
VNTKQTYTHSDYHIHYIACAPSDYPSAQRSAGGLTYIVITGASYSRPKAFGFLLSLQEKFLDEFDASETDFGALPSYGCASFNTTLKKLMIEKGATEAGQQDALRTAQVCPSLAYPPTLHTN